MLTVPVSEFHPIGNFGSGGKSEEQKKFEKGFFEIGMNMLKQLDPDRFQSDFSHDADDDGTESKND